MITLESHWPSSRKVLGHSCAGKVSAKGVADIALGFPTPSR